MNKAANTIVDNMASIIATLNTDWLKANTRSMHRVIGEFEGMSSSAQIMDDYAEPASYYVEEAIERAKKHENPYGEYHADEFKKMWEALS